MLNLGVKMDEEDKSLLLLCLLPFFYNPFMMMLLYGKEVLFYEDIVSILRSNEQRKKLINERTPQEDLAVGERFGRGKDI